MLQLKELDVDVIRVMADFHSKTPVEMDEEVKKVSKCIALLILFLVTDQ